MTHNPCAIVEGQTRHLHGYPVTVLSGCRPGVGGKDGHDVRFDTLLHRDTYAPHETSAYCWEIGPIVASPVHN